jgi:hypothetical protein
MLKHFFSSPLLRLALLFFFLSDSPSLALFLLASLVSSSLFFSPHVLMLTRSLTHSTVRALLSDDDDDDDLFSFVDFSTL